MAAEPPFTPHNNLLFKDESRKAFDFEKTMTDEIQEMDKEK
jgi:hypothetical protein